MGTSQETLAALYRQASPVVFRRAMRILGNEDDALDAVQEVFLTLQKKLDTFRGDAALMTWVYRVTTNHCLNVLRSRHTRQRSLESMAHMQSFGSVIETSTALERRNLLTRLLAEVGERNVQAAVHFYCDEMSQEEIAQILGISERSVRKALKKVREHAGDALAALDLSGGEAMA